MKKRILLFLPIIIAFLGCSKDDDPVEDVIYEKVETTPMNLPQEFIVGKKETIRLSYKRPTSCHRFSGIEYEELKGEMIFGVVTAYKPSESCESISFSGSTSFEFTPESTDFYIFKFWQRRTEQGQDVYLTVQVPVKANST